MHIEDNGTQDLHTLELRDVSCWIDGSVFGWCHLAALLGFPHLKLWWHLSLTRQYGQGADAHKIACPDRRLPVHFCYSEQSALLLQVQLCGQGAYLIDHSQILMLKANSL